MMAIKNKNGSYYKLEGPNPIMEQQSSWDAHVMHNSPKFGQSVIFPDNKMPITQVKQIDMPQETMPEEMPVPKVDEGPAIIEKLEISNAPISIMEDEIEVWCLPAHYVDVTDPIHGEKFRRIKYGQKFLFNAQLVEQDDLYTILWTKTKAVVEGAIIYPKTGDKRWWRVQKQKEEEGGGYLIHAEITDYHPHFS